MHTHVKLNRVEKTGYISFYSENPKKPPTLDFNVLDELDKLILKIRGSIVQYRIIIVQSSSTKYFIVGANLEALKEIDNNSIIRWVTTGHKVFNNLSALTIPIIAKISGYALGGGLELALACDIIAATRDSFFGHPEANLGFVPGWGGSIRLQKRIGISKAKEMFFTADIVDAGTAYKMRLCDFVGTREEVDRYLNHLILKVTENSKIAVSMVKKLVENGYLKNTVQTDYYEEALASSICIASGDTQARLKNFFNKRAVKQE